MKKIRHVWYGSFDYAGYGFQAISVSPEELEKVLRKQYYKIRKLYKGEKTWKEWKQYSGVLYQEVVLGTPFGSGMGLSDKLKHISHG